MKIIKDLPAPSHLYSPPPSRLHALFLLFLASLPLHANLSPLPTGATVTGKSQHHRTVQTADGKSQTEVAGFMFYKDQETGELRESKEDIEIFEGAAVARQGAHRVLWSANCNEVGAVSQETPCGRTLNSRVMGISYYSSVTGESVLIGEIQDSQGIVVGDSMVVYPEALDSANCTLMYVYRRDSLEQFLSLKQRLPDPGLWNLREEGLHVQVWTEFFSPEQPALTSYVISGQTDQAKRAAMASPDFRDQLIEYPEFRFGRGKAFWIENDALINAGITVEKHVPVGTEWIHYPDLQRTFLVESMPYERLKPLLQALPEFAGVNDDPQKEQELVARRKKVKSPHLLLSGGTGSTPSQISPLPPFQKRLQVAQSKNRDQLHKFSRMDTASPQFARLGTPAVVLDYVTLSVNTNSYTFRQDSTTFITGRLTMGGTTTLERGACLKFASNNCTLVIGGSGAKLVTPTNMWSTVTLTGKDDDAIGEIISGSTSNPTTNSYGAYLELDYPTAGQSYDIYNLRCKFASIALSLYFGSPRKLYHCSFIKCGTVVQAASTDVTLLNCLVYNANNVIDPGAGAPKLRGEHVTVNKCGYLDADINSYDEPPDYWFTNSIFCDVGNLPFIIGASNTTAGAAADLFTQVGSSLHYLKNGCVARNSGTTNLSAGLLDAIRKRTTYGPTILSNDIVMDVTLRPTAQRDMDQLDRGWHAEPLDYAFSEVTISNATVLITNGATMGVFGSTGIKLHNSSKLISEGHPLRQCAIFRYELVQEQSTNVWTNGSNCVLFKDGDVTGTKPEALFRFTQFPAIANGGSHFTGGSNMSVLAFSDCSFFGGKINWNADGTTGRTLALTNNLFEACTNTFGTDTDPVTLHARNNLFRLGSLYLKPKNGNDWTWKDNAFDTVTLTQNAYSIVNSNNGYMSTTRISPNAANDVTTSVTWQAGQLGNYYQLTNSAYVNKGSANANTCGLWHFTSNTNSVAETNTVVDLGLHYPMLDLSTSPGSGTFPWVLWNHDGDYIPSYAEDRNGNGQFDSGESSHTTYNSRFGIGSGPGLQVWTPLK